jgi:hypothetical protein
MDPSKPPVSPIPLPLHPNEPEQKEFVHPIPRPINERLSLDPPVRIAGGMFLALMTGLSAGFMRGYQAGGLRFRAENAHRQPKSEKGWFFYHRSKTHFSTLAGMKVAVRTGAVLALLTGMILGLEDQFDRLRGGESRDVLSTVMAGTVSGGLYSFARKLLHRVGLRLANW